MGGFLTCCAQPRAEEIGFLVETGFHVKDSAGTGVLWYLQIKNHDALHGAYNTPLRHEKNRLRRKEVPMGNRGAWFWLMLLMVYGLITRILELQTAWINFATELLKLFNQ